MSEKISRINAAKKLGVSLVTLNTWDKKGIGPKKIMFGGRAFYDLKEVNDYLNRKGR